MFSVREIIYSDLEPLADYWMNASSEFLVSMGVDLSKMPERMPMISMISEQLTQDYPDKKSYCIIWLIDGKPSGHSNINKIIFGEEASMHLHLWNSTQRKSGTGTQMVKLTLPFFFKNFKLKKLYCEPYALNPAPNKTLAKAGFDFIKKYSTIPGAINFMQDVNRWEMTKEKFEKIVSA